MLEIEKRIPRRFTNACIHYFVTLSIIITGFLSPLVANGEITLLSPGINADDPVDENLAVTDKLTVFKWSSTSPQDSTSVYAIEMSFHKDFRNIDGGVVLDDNFFSVITLSRNASRTIVNVAYDLSNDFDNPAGETLELDLLEGIYWRVRLMVIGEPDELSPVFFTFYRYTQIQSSSTILGLVVSSDLNNALLSAANITIEAGDNSTSLLGNQPNNMISLSTDDDGRFLGFAVSLVDLSVTPPVIANEFPFPLKIIVRKAGFLDLTREIADRNQLEATCDIANPTNEGTCFILTPDSPPPPPPDPPVPPTPGKVSLVHIYQLLLGTKTP